MEKVYGNPEIAQEHFKVISRCRETVRYQPQDHTTLHWEAITDIKGCQAKIPVLHFRWNPQTHPAPHGLNTFFVRLVRSHWRPPSVHFRINQPKTSETAVGRWRRRTKKFQPMFIELYPQLDPLQRLLITSAHHLREHLDSGKLLPRSHLRNIKNLGHKQHVWVF